MARSNDIITLVDASLRNDRQRVLSICRIMMAHEKDTSTMKQRLEKLLARTGGLDIDSVPADIKKLVLHSQTEKTLDDVILPNDVLRDVQTFLEERSKSDLLHGFNLPTTNRLLLSGPPGNGKTSLAEAIGNTLNLPVLVVDFSQVIASYLGSTGSNLAKIFRAAASFPCVLFIDEMETLLSERKNVDNSEMARIVSTLIIELDRMPDSTIIIGATNHTDMLDRAIARRFDYHWDFPSPSAEQQQSWLDAFAKKMPKIPVGSFDIQTNHTSFSDLERETIHQCKKWVMSQH